MHDQPTCGSGLSPAELEKQRENSVLWHVFGTYPAMFAVDELVSELIPPGSTAVMEREGFNTAIRSLAARGLLRRHGSFVSLSRTPKVTRVRGPVR